MQLYTHICTCIYTHTQTLCLMSILSNAMHLDLLHMMNHFSRAAGDILSYRLLPSKRYLTIILINYKTLLFVHISGISRGRDETCPYDNVQTKSLLSFIHWMSIRPFQLISYKTALLDTCTFIFRLRRQNI